MTYVETWLDRLLALVVRFPEYCTQADVATMSMADLWGLYRFLGRIDREA